jgi:Ca2+/Na+ antiporter
MNVFLVLLFGIILISVFIVFLFISKKSIKKSKKPINNNSNLNNIDIKMVDISFLKIPKRIKEMEPSLLYKDCKNLLENFKVLKYNKKERNELSLIEWNNWEVFMLIGLIKINKDIFISNPLEIFHPSIANLTKPELIKEINRIFLKYNRIDKDFTYDILRSQLNWSAREVSIIFLYLSVHKNI